MSKSALRYKKLIQELPKHKTAQDAVLSAGFSPSVARTQSKRVLQSAIKYQAREILERTDENIKGKQLMSEIVGLSRENLFERLRFIATQEKDLSSALKVLGPLSKEHGVVLSTEETANVTVPVLNVVVQNTDMPDVKQDSSE